MIVYFEAKQPTRVADKIFSQLTFPRVEFTGTESVFRRTKRNWSQIIPRVSFTVHFEFSAQHRMNAV